ncbi:MAG: tail fiber domain-containing protein [Desulfovibrio sp.]|nr:tail fiber domain-containing protein [Desulfovibrio sp.]
MATEFAFTFKVWDPSQIRVTIADSGDILTDVTDDATIVLDDDAGGTVIYTLDGAPLPSGYTLAITRNMPFVQRVDLVSATRFDPEVIETRLDQDCAERQELREKLDRAITVLPTSDESGEELLQDIYAARNSAANSALESADSAALAQAWAESETPPDPGDANSKSSKTWAGLSAASKGQADAAANLARAWAQSSTPPDPSDSTSKSSKTWAAQAATSASQAQAIVDGGIIATGTTTSRLFADRFADVVNVKDFGAKGDGVTDDTTAFEAAAAKKKTVFVPKGRYVLSHKVDGIFISDGYVEAPYVNVVNTLSPIVSSACFSIDPVDCGGDYPNIDPSVNSQRWDRATQGIFVDPYTNVMYVTVNITGGKTGLYAFRWSEDPTQRTVLGWSGWKYGFVGHQGMGFYRDSTKFRIIGKSNPAISYDSGTGTVTYDYTKTFTANVIDWDYSSPSTFTIERTFTLFNSTNFDNTQDMQTCVSYDGKWLVAMAYDVVEENATQTRTIRVWDLAKIMQGDANNIEGLQSYSFKSPWGNYGGQGLACDGTLIYLLSGDASTYIGTVTLNGKKGWGVNQNYASVIDSDAICRNASSSGTTPVYSDGIETETEGLFFAPWHGKIRTFLHLSVKARWTETEGGEPVSHYHRYDRFLGFINETSGDTCSFGQIVLDGVGASKGAVFVDQNNSDATVFTITVNQYNAYLVNRSTGNIQILVAGTTSNGIDVGNTYVRPHVTNSVSLGDGSHSWSNVYATTGPWSSSDVRLKANISKPSDALMRAWGKVGFKVFQMKDAIEKKGVNARIHIGVIAQEVQEAFSSEALDAGRYGLFGYDSWGNEYEEVEVVDAEAVVDSDGNKVSPTVAHTEKRLIQEAGDKYSIRYEEALALECVYQRDRADKAETRIAALEERMAALEAKLAQMER